MPIVEPEILSDGTHSIEACAEATERVMAGVMKALLDQKVLIEGMLLKPNMVTSGKEAEHVSTPSEVAWYTVRSFGRTLVPNVPGITFLSGGWSEEDASVYLNAINQIEGVVKPWKLSFSFGRALIPVHHRPLPLALIPVHHRPLPLALIPVHHRPLPLALI